jgi:hypothetical protein
MNLMSPKPFAIAYSSENIQTKKAHIFYKFYKLPDGWQAADGIFN